MQSYKVIKINKFFCCSAVCSRVEQKFIIPDNGRHNSTRRIRSSTCQVAKFITVTYEEPTDLSVCFVTSPEKA